MIINYKNLDKKDFLTKYFNILNTAQPVKSKRLTGTEIMVLIEFLLLPDKFENKRFGTLARKKVLDYLLEGGYTLTRGNLNNKIYSMIEKGYLRKDIDGVIYPKDFVSHGFKGITSTINNGDNFDIIFRFNNDLQAS